jgi:hypothetical protein
MIQQGNVLIDFTKWLFKCIVVLVVLAVGGFWTWNWWFYQRHKDRIEVMALNSATPGLFKSNFITRDHKDAETQCGGEFPIFIAYLNNSSRTIEYISIGVTAHLPERSTNILTYDSTASSDQIVKPDEGVSSCWRFTFVNYYKNDPEIAKAIYSGKINYVRFKDD